MESSEGVHVALYTVLLLMLLYPSMIATSFLFFFLLLPGLFKLSPLTENISNRQTNYAPASLCTQINCQCVSLTESNSIRIQNFLF